ncbi:antibiotic biosynthesis monooxygenase [Halomonas sp. McH1-25]|uniref:antibiotic biosynthesis monooxygenase n=1 Tax=unclassified Halomonas TaxID=2609666 RepID=UPI001EF4A17F|nr:MULTISPECIES: antibiotic biosynthesis monooxygenase [unclassified Halomonas]MCG7600814.1 antibiotic biosynthesis monooxygenase [Halomonas sp. McH1-25]MCP1344325.1 antibiotic biosynthesis monooxygenase [Halomonas sp. FL8]MCP1363011.1 antibiotic biosynthesis monooxygenase [Halomonas sp. BBD45]MCP1366101.1 antibiotic biosynthesis monooxygenase [Halomonas sp. BBD48]
MTQQASEIVTLVVRHRVKAGMNQQYETWLRRIVKTASQMSGHLGVNVIRSKSQGLPLFTSVLRFSHVRHMQAWLDSAERQELVAEVEHLLADGDQTEVSTDKEFWFVPNDGESRPPRWKQACVTFLVILPLSLLVPLLWQPLFGWQPVLGGYLSRGVLITLTIVLLVVYVFMPLATRLFASWLNGPQSEEAT